MAIALGEAMIPLRRGAVLASLTLLALVIVNACHSSASGSTGGKEAAHVSMHAPAVDAKKVVDLAGVHNVVTYAPNMIGGGQPEGAEGLETLAAMGIKTIVSVDGATPDVEGAKKLGMRYVHLPISYDTVTPERQQQLAQVVANCEGPIYMHCHHGKHRSAGALACALVVAGKTTPEQAQERMAVSGTAKDYTGLWAAVRGAK